jgi:hypothetical protein
MGDARNLPIQRWGDRVVMSDAPLETSNRPDRMSCWGRVERVFVAGPEVELARVETNGEGASQSFLISIDVLEPIPDVTQNLFETVGSSVAAYVWARIEAGNGAESFTRLVRIDDRLDMCVVGSLVRVTCFMADAMGSVKALTPWNTGVQATMYSTQVACNVSRQVRGAPYVPNQNLTGFSAGPAILSPNLAAVPLQVLGLHAHLAVASVGDLGAPVNLFLQLFDVGTTADVGVNRVPDDEYVLSGGHPMQEVEEVFLNPRGFGRGFVYAVSTTSGKYVASAAKVWIQIQRQSL